MAIGCFSAPLLFSNEMSRSTDKVKVKSEILLPFSMYINTDQLAGIEQQLNV